MPYLTHKADCSGCAACFNICPVQCITMDADQEGFLYPHINEDQCIHCNQCEKVCPAVHSMENTFDSCAYVGFSSDSNSRAKSSSGGVFSLLAESIFKQGGCVYGAGFNDAYAVKHQCAESRRELQILRGSKYVQSDVGWTYKEVLEKLEAGRIVLYSGTPCEIEALLSYLKKPYKNLYTQDIICHGVPSPEVWKAYLQHRCGDIPIEKLSFRSKKYGWHYFSMEIETQSRIYCKRLDEDPYIRLFMDNVILRPSCYECKFKKEHRISDFTLADCWNLSATGASIVDDDRGISMLFINSRKGKELFEEIKKSGTFEEIPMENALLAQTAATRSVAKNPDREIFFANMHKYGAVKTIQNWYGKNVLYRLHTRLVFTKYRVKKLLKG